MQALKSLHQRYARITFTRSVIYLQNAVRQKFYVVPKLRNQSLRRIPRQFISPPYPSTSRNQTGWTWDAGNRCFAISSQTCQHECKHLCPSGRYMPQLSVPPFIGCGPDRKAPLLRFARSCEFRELANGGVGRAALRRCSVFNGNLVLLSY